MIVGFPVKIDPHWTVDLCLTDYNQCVKGIVLSHQYYTAELSITHCLPLRKDGRVYWDVKCLVSSKTVKHLLSDDASKINAMVSEFLTNGDA